MVCACDEHGVDNLRGQAAFLAFAQADPDTTADNLHSLNPGSRASLKKALTRLERKLQLSTLLESVIDAYLAQRPTAWATFTQAQEVKGRLFSASDIALGGLTISCNTPSMRMRMRKSSSYVSK